MADQFVIRPERPLDSPLAQGLIARAFGPGRHAKAAERLREGSTPVPGLSFLAWSGRRAVGCVRLWPIVIGGRAAVLLGPFAVDDDFRGAGVGAALVARACKAAAEAGHELVLLVGDEAYFGPLGFEVAVDVRMPGPVDPRRIMVRSLVGDRGATPGGAVRAASARPLELALA